MRLTSKGIYIVKIRNHPHTIMPPKSELVRRRGYGSRTLEMHLQLRDQQRKTTSHMFRLSYQNFTAAANQKSTIDTQTIRKINPNTTPKSVIKPQEERTREEGKKKEQQKQIQSN